MSRPTLVCSQKLYDEIKARNIDKNCREVTIEKMSPGGIATVHKLDLYGIYLRVSTMLPTINPRGRVVSLDRFATYEPADMWYAEPLKLARWEPVETHCYLVNEPMPQYLRGTL